MTTMTADRHVEEYLRRLEAAAAGLPPARRAELVEEIREHIDHAVAEADTTDEIAIRNVLERLGPPEEIVQAAAGPPAPESGRTGWLEIGTVFAFLVPFVGWVIGLVLLAMSRAWSSREKLLGIALLLVPLLLPIIGVTAESGAEEAVPLGDERPVGEKTSDDPSPGVFMALAFLAGLPSAVYLGWRLRHRTE